MLHFAYDFVFMIFGYFLEICKNPAYQKDIRDFV